MLRYSHQRTRGARTMSERDGFQPGVPSWVDVTGPDTDRLTGFYGAVFGWDFTGPGEIPGYPPGKYFVAQLRGRDVAGVASLPPQSGGPRWNTYIEVESVDGTAGDIEQAGGTILAQPFDAPPAGRIAVAADPTGASFAIWEPRGRRGRVLRDGLRLDARHLRGRRPGDRSLPPPRLRGRRAPAARAARPGRHGGAARWRDRLERRLLDRRRGARGGRCGAARRKRGLADLGEHPELPRGRARRPQRRAVRREPADAGRAGGVVLSDAHVATRIPVHDLRTTVAALKERGVVFEDVDL